MHQRSVFIPERSTIGKLRNILAFSYTFGILLISGTGGTETGTKRVTEQIVNVGVIADEERKIRRSFARRRAPRWRLTNARDVIVWRAAASVIVRWIRWIFDL